MAIKRGTKVDPSTSASSMTDLMFQLLLFMLISTTLINPNALKLMLPKSSNQLKEKPYTTVSITKDLNYYVEMEPVSLDAGGRGSYRIAALRQKRAGGRSGQGDEYRQE